MAFDIGVFLLVCGVLTSCCTTWPAASTRSAVKLAFALAAAILFGTGAYLLLNRDLVRVVPASC